MVAALRERNLLDRAMTSTMEGALHSTRWASWNRPCGADGRCPRSAATGRATAWRGPLVAAGLATMRARLPSVVRRHAPRLGVTSIWLYHPLATPAILDAAHDSGAKLICWTVDDPERMDALPALGVDGICTNDPRFFAQAGRPA